MSEVKADKSIRVLSREKHLHGNKILDWATDVTQINIGSEKLFLSLVLDMFNGEIISYNISKSLNLGQIYDMLDKAFAIAKFDNLDGLIIHSD